MRITIVGAGPVGLLTGCLLANNHNVTILDKRTEPTRSHGLNINDDIIKFIIDYLQETYLLEKIKPLCNLLESWRHTPISTIDIETQLSHWAQQLNVIIRRGINVTSIDDIENNIIIGADGAHSKIREIVLMEKKQIFIMFNIWHN